MDIQSFKMKVAKFLKLTNPSRVVVTREADESIVVGGAVITIVRVKGKQVRLGIIADKETKVDRMNEDGCLETKERFNDNKVREAKGNIAMGENSRS